VSRIDSPWLGVTFDSANLAKTSDPYAELARIAPYAVTAQVKPTIPVDGERVPTDYQRVIGLLREADYRGYVILEYEEEDGREGIPEALSALREAMG